MRDAGRTDRAGSVGPLEGTDEIKALARVVLSEQRSNLEASCGVAVISANRGAGTTSISNAITACVNKVAMEREASRMAANIADTISIGSVHGERSRMMAAIQEVVTETAICTDASRLAVTLDYRRLNQSGVEFGTVVAAALTPEVLRSQTNAGQSVKDVLDGLPIEWDSMSHCRQECLSLIGDLFRLVVIDMPSREEHSGFPEVTSLVSGVIIVVEEDVTSKREVSILTHEVEASGGKVIGYVLNKHRSPIPKSLLKYLAKVGLT